MAAITPQSTIKFYSDIYLEGGFCPAVFPTAAAQAAYFTAHEETTINNATYVKATGDGSGVVKVTIPENKVDKVNYMSYINKGNENKIYYCTISRPKYINNETREVAFIVDDFQTYYIGNSDAHFAPWTFIDREHASKAHTTAAATNPYDPDLWELRTPEDLPFSTDLEKPNYEIDKTNTAGTGDAKILFDQSANYHSYVPLIYLANIDFDYLDEGMPEGTSPTDLPSYIFNQFLANSKFYQEPGGQVHTTGGTAFSYNLFNNACYIIATGTGTYSLNNLLEYLTKWNCLSAIVNIYMITENLIKYIYYTADEQTHSIGLMPPGFIPNNKYHSVISKKLNLFPFTFARIITPAGDVAEYKWEDCGLLSGTSGNTTNYFPFYMYMDIADRPSLIAAPGYYKLQKFDNLYGVQNYIDCQNIVKFSQSPTAPYSIDSYQAQIAATAAQYCTDNTHLAEYQRDLAQYRYESDPLTAAKLAVSENQLLNKAGSNLFSGADFFTNAAAYDLNVFKAQDKIMNAAGATLAGSDDTAITRNMRSRPAFAANQYTPMHGEGIDHYGKYGWYNMLALRVQLRDDIIESYDSYFQTYGYNSGRAGVPFIDNYIHNTGTDDDLPTWITQANGIKTTYLKIMDGTFTGLRDDVSRRLIDLFKQGVILIKGDELQ